MTQDGQTIGNTRLRIAHDAGLLLWCREDTVFADYPAKVGTPKRELVYKKDFTLLRDFDLQFKLPENVAGRPKGVQVRGRARGGKRLTGQSEEAQRGHEEVRLKRDLATHTKARATLRAQRKGNSIGSTRFFEPLEVKSNGRDDVRDTIRILGRDDVQWRLPGCRVSHEFSPGD